MAQQWHFEQDAEQQWHWKRLEDEAESRETFASAADCMLDAVRTTVQRRREQAEAARKNLLQ